MMSRRLEVLLALATLHTALLVTSTIAGAKLVALPFGLAASATVLTYTFSFVVLDTVAELYGSATTRFVINLGLGAMVVTASLLQLAVFLPPAPGWQGQQAFAFVVSGSWRIWLAGWTAYTISQNLDAWIYLRLKRRLDRSPAARAVVSLSAGQLVDTIVFVLIAFYGTPSLLGVILGQYLVKVAIGSVAAPLVGKGIRLCRWVLGEDGGGDARELAPEPREPRDVVG